MPLERPEVLPRSKWPALSFVYRGATVRCWTVFFRYLFVEGQIMMFPPTTSEKVWSDQVSPALFPVLTSTLSSIAAVAGQQQCCPPVRLVPVCYTRAFCDTRFTILWERAQRRVKSERSHTGGGPASRDTRGAQIPVLGGSLSRRRRFTLYLPG